MGLDQYLHAEIALPIYDLLRDEFKTEEAKRLSDLRETILETFRASDLNHKTALQSGFFELPMTCNVKIQVMYWRKANQIHAFFEKEHGSEIKNCEDITVSTQTLNKLLSLIKEILAEPGDKKKAAKAEKLLPTQTGFYFGSTEYNDVYFQDLRETMVSLEYILARADKHWQFIYHGWW